MYVEESYVNWLFIGIHRFIFVKIVVEWWMYVEESCATVSITLSTLRIYPVYTLYTSSLPYMHLYVHPYTMYILEYTIYTLYTHHIHTIYKPNIYKPSTNIPRYTFHPHDTHMIGGIDRGPCRTPHTARVLREQVRLIGYYIKWFPHRPRTARASTFGGE